MKVLFDRVLIRKALPKDKTESGLFIPQQAQFTLEGAVVAVGPKVVELKKGDRILFPQYATFTSEL